MKKINLITLLAVAEVFVVVMAILIFGLTGRISAIINGETNLAEATGMVDNLYLLQVVFFSIIFILIAISIFQLWMFLNNLKQKASINENEVVQVQQKETETDTTENEEKIQQELKDKAEQRKKIIESELDAISTDDTNDNVKISEKILTAISKGFELTQAEIFIKRIEEDQEKLTLSATYAFYIPEEKVFEFKMGEGLIGQVAVAGKSLYLKELPEGYITVKSGLGNATPGNLAIIPWKDKNDKPFAILEIAAFEKFSEYDIEVLEYLSPKIFRYYQNQEDINQTDSMK